MTATINGTAKNQAFSYDNVGRLVTATGSGWQRRFAYDRWGNRTGVWNAVTGGTQIQTISLQQPGGVTNNRIASVGGVNYVYDNGGAGTGNVTSDGGHSYQYDGENRLVKVDNGSTAVNTYDAANRRVKKVTAAGTTWYVWEGGAVIAEYGAASSGTSNIRYYHADRLSTRMITDESGGVAGTQDHLPFGEDAGVTGESEKHRFTNYERDAESGTDYAVNRQYSNATGRFMRPDPVAGSVLDPQSLNRYAYTTNDPINLLDPLGLESYYPQNPNGEGASGVCPARFNTCAWVNFSGVWVLAGLDGLGGGEFLWGSVRLFGQLEYLSRLFKETGWPKYFRVVENPLEARQFDWKNFDLGIALKTVRSQIRKQFEDALAQCEDEAETYIAQTLAREEVDLKEAFEKLKTDQAGGLLLGLATSGFVKPYGLSFLTALAGSPEGYLSKRDLRILDETRRQAQNLLKKCRKSVKKRFGLK
jgi:RHS repeat-associated protein